MSLLRDGLAPLGSRRAALGRPTVDVPSHADRRRDRRGADLLTGVSDRERSDRLSRMQSWRSSFSWRMLFTTPMKSVFHPATQCPSQGRPAQVAVEPGRLVAALAALAEVIDPLYVDGLGVRITSEFGWVTAHPR